MDKAKRKVWTYSSASSALAAILGIWGGIMLSNPVTIIHGEYAEEDYVIPIGVPMSLIWTEENQQSHGYPNHYTYFGHVVESNLVFEDGKPSELRLTLNDVRRPINGE